MYLRTHILAKGISALLKTILHLLIIYFPGELIIGHDQKCDHALPVMHCISMYLLAVYLDFKFRGNPVKMKNYLLLYKMPSEISCRFEYSELLISAGILSYEYLGLHSTWVLNSPYQVCYVRLHIHRVMAQNGEALTFIIKVRVTNISVWTVIRLYNLFFVYIYRSWQSIFELEGYKWSRNLDVRCCCRWKLLW